MVIERLEKTVYGAEFQAALTSSAAELGFEIQGEAISRGDEKYRVKKMDEFKHEHGQGGHSLDSFILFKVNKEEKKVLETRNYTSWTTYSDDSEDHTMVNEHSLTIYSEDQLARAVFEKCKGGGENGKDNVK